MKKKNGGIKVIQDLKELLGIDNPEVGTIDELEELDGIEDTGIIEVNAGKESEVPVQKEVPTPTRDKEVVYLL